MKAKQTMSRSVPEAIYDFIVVAGIAEVINSSSAFRHPVATPKMDGRKLYALISDYVKAPRRQTVGLVKSAMPDAPVSVRRPIVHAVNALMGTLS